MIENAHSRTDACNTPSRAWLSGVWSSVAKPPELREVVNVTSIQRLAPSGSWIHPKVTTGTANFAWWGFARPRFVRSVFFLIIQVAMSSSMFYCIIRAGDGVLCLLGPTTLRVQYLDTTTPSFPVLFVSNERLHFLTLYDTIFALVRLKICYCSWPPKTIDLQQQYAL